MTVGVVLVHGFSGSPDDFAPLTAAIAAQYGADAVTVLTLPGHCAGQVPAVELDATMAAIAAAIADYRREGRTTVLAGHSTGGTFAVAMLAEQRSAPDLLVLAGVPQSIDAAYLDRWQRHRHGKMPVSFTTVAQLITLINRVGRQQLPGEFPVLVLHGAADTLVPDAAAFARGGNSQPGLVRTVIVPGAGHDLFRGENHLLAVELVMRAIADHASSRSTRDDATLTALAALEPELSRFLEHSPSSWRHVCRCPSGQTARGELPRLPTGHDIEPVFANIEITTRCNLRCIHCARTIAGREGRDMDPQTFASVLGLLPHAYRITLVGLGEPLLHPRVTDFVAAASAQGRRTALVTNAMALDSSLSRELLRAGLDSIAFSIDGPDQRSAAELRPGTDLARVLANIREFVALAKSVRPVSTAVFSSLSSKTAPSLQQLTEVIAGLGVHVLMLSDLNFRENVGQTLWKNMDSDTAALLKTAVRRSLRHNLPVLSVHGLEEFGLWKRYGKFLLLPPDELFQRSQKQRWCYSPWQTIPVNVAGEVTLCDCQPEISAGNILRQPLATVWHGAVLEEHRRRMLSDDPPEACKICPRF